MGSKSQEGLTDHLNYQVPERKKLLPPLYLFKFPNIVRFWVYSSKKLLIIFKKSDNLGDSEELFAKIVVRNNENFTDSSNILPIPKKFMDLSVISFLRFEFRNQTKKNLFLSSGPFLALMEIQEDQTGQNLLRFIDLGGKHEVPITCLANCREDREEGYYLLSGDNHGNIRVWKFSGENELIEDRDFQKMESEQPQPITSLTFNKSLDKVAAGNSISQWRVWGFPNANEIKGARLEAKSDENVFVRFSQKNEEILYAAIERGTLFEIDLSEENQNNKKVVLGRRNLIQNTRRRIDDFKINYLFSSHKRNFLVLMSMETYADESFTQNFIFFSESRGLIEEKIAIKEECVNASIYNNIFAYATNDYVQVYKLNEDFRISIQHRAMSEIKKSWIFPDNSFWIAGSKQIHYGFYSKKESRPIFSTLDDQEKEQNLSSLAFCQVKNLLAISYEQKIKIWSVTISIQNDKPNVKYQLLGRVKIADIELRHITFDRNGEILIFAGTDKIGYLSMQNLADPVIVLGTPLTHAKSLLFYNEKRIIIFSGRANSEHVIALWFLNDLSGKHYKYLKTHTGTINSLALDDGLGLLYSGGNDGRIVIWNLNDEHVESFEKEIRTQNFKILSLAVSNDKRKVAGVCGDSTQKFYIKLWNLDTGILERTWDVREGIKTLSFGKNDKCFIVGNNQNLEIIKIKDYFYKSSFHVLNDILDERLGLQESIQRYPQIFNETLLREIFLHYENKNQFQTILHLYAYIFCQNRENHYEECLKICETFKIIPKFSLDINNKTPLDYISKDLLVLSLKLLTKYQLPLSFCPAINTGVLQRLGRCDPLLLMQVLQNRFCESYGVSDLHLPEFEGPIFLTFDRIMPTNYIAETIEPKLNQTNETKTYRKNYEIRILDVPDILNPDNSIIQSTLNSVEPNHPLYGIREFEAILEIKWDNYVAKRFFKKGLIFLLYVVLLTVYSVFILPKRLYPDSDDEYQERLKEGFAEKYHVISVILDVMLISFVGYFLLTEFSEMIRRKAQYWKDMWNYFDLLNMGFLICSLIIDFLNIFSKYGDAHFLKALFAVTLFLAWLRLITYSRGFKGLGFMVRLLVQVFVDMKNFLFLMFFITLSITVAGFLLQDYNKFNILQTFNSFYRLIIGDFSGFDDLSDSGIDWLLWIFFFIGTLSLQITMLNLLIAIISSTFQKVTDNNTIANNFEKVQIVAEIDESLAQSERKTLNLKKYLCVVYSKDINDKEEKKNDEVMLRIDKLEEKIDEITNLLKGKKNI